MDPTEETQEVTEEKEEEIWGEATEEETSKEEETDDSKGEASEEEKEEEDQEGTEGDQEESEEKAEKEEEVDYKTQVKELQDKLTVAEKMAKDNKAFADDQARLRAEDKKRALEEKEKAEAEELENPPDDVKHFVEEYPEAQKAITFYSKGLIRQAINEYEAVLTEAAGGKKPVELIRETRELQNTLNFERGLMFGYYDEKGQRVPGHPDVLDIIFTPEFEEWAEKQAKADSTFNERQNDLTEAIKIVSQYKTEKLQEAGKKRDEDLQKTKEEMEEGMTSADRETVQKGRKAEPDRYDEDQAAKDAGFTT